MSVNKISISNHAVKKYYERVYPGKPLPDGEERSDAFRQAKALLIGEVERSTLLPSQTWRGQEQRLLASGDGVAVCKKDKGWTIVVTILGSGESLYAADEEIVEAISRAAEKKVSGVAENAICSLPKQQRAAIGDIKQAALGLAKKLILERTGQIIDGLMTLHTQNAKAAAKRLCEAKASCVECEHNRRALEWLRGEDHSLSLSSRVIFDHFMFGAPKSSFAFAPVDMSDLGRCIRLLNQPFAEGWRVRMGELTKCPQWKHLAEQWPTVDALYQVSEHDNESRGKLEAILENR